MHYLNGKIIIYDKCRLSDSFVICNKIVGQHFQKESVVRNLVGKT
jgi:hypothetical protein